MILVGALLSPATAVAQDDDDDDDGGAQVAIVGTPRVGATLEAVPRFENDDATYAWHRCPGAAAASCAPIAGATAQRYVPTSADVGRRIQVRMRVRSDDDDDGPLVVGSALTAPVAAAPAGSSPPPSPGAAPASPAPSTTSAPLTGGSPARRSPRRPRVMRPAPTVRIAGVFTRRGAKLTRLSVRAPRGVRIAVRCSGDGCPRRALALATAFTRLRAFERSMPAGTRLEIRITRPGYVGKHTLIRIRRGKPPSRRDRCLYPGSGVPRRCAG